MKGLSSRLLFIVTLLLAVALSALAYQMLGARQTSGEAAAAPLPELPIVMYHHILKEQSRLNKYTISPDEFRQDMEYLRDNGYTPVTMTQLIRFCDAGEPLPVRPVIITFDDGYESFHEYAYPVLKEFGFKAVFSVVGRYADQYSETEDHHIRYSHCSWEQLGEMQESGLVEIQNHTYNMHVNANGRHGAKKMQGESDEAYRGVFLEDVGRMQEECYEYLGIYPNTFTYPFGQISPEALPLIKELGFRAALSCQEKLNYLTGDEEQLYHLNRFNRPHGVSLESLIEKARAKETKQNAAG